MNAKIGVCQWRIPIPDAGEGIRWASELGLRGIGLDFGKDANCPSLRDIEIQKHYNEWRHQWRVVYTSLGVGALHNFGMSVTAHRKMVEAAIEGAIEVATGLGISVIQLPSFGNGEISSSEDFRNTVKCLQYACKHADEAGIIVESENSRSAEEQIRMIEDVGAVNLRICFDTRNPFRMKRYNVPLLLEKLFPFVYEVHLKDGIDDRKWTRLGQGNSQFVHTLEILKEHSYTGWLLLENDYQAISRETGELLEDAVRRDIDFVRAILE